MKYKNTTNEVIEFREFDIDGVKKRKKINPEEEFEFGRELNIEGIEKVEQEMNRKTKKKLKGVDVK